MQEVDLKEVEMIDNSSTLIEEEYDDFALDCDSLQDQQSLINLHPTFQVVTFRFCVYSITGLGLIFFWWV